MGDATVSGETIREAEAAHFGALAVDWWNPAGSSAMLHRLNPVRLTFIREAIDRHWGGSFVEIGDKIEIDTRTNEYWARVKA